MFKRNYYCLVAGLPDLLFNENKLAFTSNNFLVELEKELDVKDYELIRFLFLDDDNKNLLQLLRKPQETFLTIGNFDKKLLEEQIESPTILPEYMCSFLKWIKENSIKTIDLQAENKLYSLFYDYIGQVKNEYLRNWFIFILNLNNLITSFNCNLYKYDFQNHLIKTDYNIDVFSLLIEGKFKPEYFEDEIPFADQIFRIVESDSALIEKEKSIDQVKWEYIDENTFFHYFSIEKVMSYIIKLKIIERWIKLDKELGQKLLNKLINDLKTEYEFPVEFSLEK